MFTLFCVVQVFWWQDILGGISNDYDYIYGFNAILLLACTYIMLYIHIYIYTNGADKYIYILYIHLQNYIPHSIRYHPQMNDVTGLSDHRITCHFLQMFVRRIYSRTLHELRRQILKSLTLAVQRSSKIQVRTSSPVIRCGKPEWFVLFTGAQKTVV